MGTDQNGNFISETKFDLVTSGTSQDRDVNYRHTHINVNTVNPYVFMDHSYFGTGGYRDGSYLIPFTRESDYMGRRELAAYKNYVRPIIDAMIVPVFAQQAVRIVQGNTLFDDFEENVNGSGLPLQEFTSEICTIARRHGVVFIVMDNFIDQPDTVGQAAKDRIYPYVYIRKASQVAAYEQDAFGNLTTLTFEEPATKKSDGSIEYHRRKWTATESIPYVKQGDQWQQVGEIRPVTIGRLPVIAIYADTKECTTPLVDPPLYDIARLNLMIYNMTAEIRDQERAQAFSQLYVQGIPARELASGPKTVLILPPEANIAPGFASPDSAILAGLIEHEDKIRSQIYGIAEQNGVVGVQTSRSGVALAWEFLAHEEVLRHTAAMATWCEQEIARMFGDFTNENFVYNVKYRMNYSPVGLDDEIKRYDAILKMPGVPQPLTNKIYERITRAVLVDEDQETVDQVISDMSTVDVITRPQVIPDPMITGE